MIQPKTNKNYNHEYSNKSIIISLKHFQIFSFGQYTHSHVFKQTVYDQIGKVKLQF